MKKIIFGLLMFLPGTVFACSYSDVSVSQTSCTILTEQQLQDNAIAQTKYVGNYGLSSSEKNALINSLTTGILITTPYDPWSGASDLATMDANLFQIFATLTAQNDTCKSQWATYNKNLSDYNTCLANENFAAPIATPTPPVVPAPVIVATPTPIIVPVATVTPVLVAPSISVPVSVQITPPVFSGITQKPKPQVKSDSIVNPIVNQSPAPVVQPAPIVKSMQPTPQSMQNPFIKFWSFIKSLF